MHEVLAAKGGDPRRGYDWRAPFILMLAGIGLAQRRLAADAAAEMIAWRYGVELRRFVGECRHLAG